MKKTVCAILLAVLYLVLIFGFAAEADFEEAQRQEREYCTAVADGSWPDYRGVADKLCNNKEPAK